MSDRRHSARQRHNDVSKRLVTATFPLFVVLAYFSFPGGAEAVEATSAKATTTFLGTVPPPGIFAIESIGDSLSSGEGTFSYDDVFGDPLGASCHRGRYAWPRLLRDRGAPVSMNLHRACTGATTKDMTRFDNDQPPQVGTGPVFNVTRVFLTIGANDLGFENIMRNCWSTIGPGAGDCLSTFSIPGPSKFKKFEQAVAKLEKDLTRLYGVIHKSYPNASIVHVGYPYITPPVGTTPVDCGWLSRGEQGNLRAAADILNGAIAELASRLVNVEFVPIHDALRGHELCTEQPWVVSIIGDPVSTSEQAHPNIRGQEEIADLVISRYFG